AAAQHPPSALPWGGSAAGALGEPSPVEKKPYVAGPASSTTCLIRSSEPRSTVSRSPACCGRPVFQAVARSSWTATSAPATLLVTEVVTGSTRLNGLSRSSECGQVNV